jgi:hypothetical protein
MMSGGPPNPAILNPDSPQASVVSALYPGVGSSMSPWADLKGSFDLTANVTPPALTETDWGPAPEFTGTLDQAMIHEAAAVTSYPISICVWVKLGSSSPNEIIAAIGGQNSGIAVYVDGFGQASVYFFRLAVSDAILTGPDINTGDWVHVVVTADTSNNKVLYVNGVEVDSANASVDAFFDTDYTMVGAYRPGGTLNGPLTGHVGEVRFLPYALSSAEVEELYDLSTRWGIYMTGGPSRKLAGRSITGYDLASPIERENRDTAGLQMLAMPALGPGLGQIDLIRRARPQVHDVAPLIVPDSVFGSVIRLDGLGHLYYPARPQSGSYSAAAWFRLRSPLVYNIFDMSQAIATIARFGDIWIKAEALNDETSAEIAVTGIVDYPVATIAPDDTAWHFAAVSSDVDAETTNICIDGQMLTQVNDADLLVDNTEIRIGGTTTAETDIFSQHSADVGGVALWSRAMSAAEMVRLSQPAGWMAMLRRFHRTRRYTSNQSKSIVQPMKKVQTVWDVPGPVAAW